jgi:hypothetical protein
MTVIYAISIEHPDSGDYDNSDATSEVIGYVLTEEAAKKFCDETQNREKHDKYNKQAKSWALRREAWMTANKHRYVQINHITDYLMRKDHLINQLKPIPDLTNIPANKHELVIYNIKRHNDEIEKTFAELEKKIAACCDVKTAKAKNLELDKEREAAIGDAPAYVELKQYSYQVLENLVP